MSDPKPVHMHLNDDQVEAAALAALDGSEPTLSRLDCEECHARVSARGRCLSLARLLARDTRVPFGSPAVNAVKMIRRRSYRRRALGEIASLVTASPLRDRR